MAEVRYPTLDTGALSCSSAESSFAEVTKFDYSKGWALGMDRGADDFATLDYHLNGQLAEVLFQSETLVAGEYATRLSYGLDPQFMQRPGSIVIRRRAGNFTSLLLAYL